MAADGEGVFLMTHLFRSADCPLDGRFLRAFGVSQSVMSLCKHLPNGTTLIKWRMGNYDEKWATAVYGDRWCSGLFTTNLDGNPQCCLLFCPPVDRAAYSPQHPRLASSDNYVGARVTARFVNVTPTIEMAAWMETANGEIVGQKKNAESKEIQLQVHAIKQQSTAKVVFICCEIRKPGRGPVDPLEASLNGKVEAVDRQTASMEFEWKTTYSQYKPNEQKSVPMSVKGTQQKFSLISTADLRSLLLKNAEPESAEPFHYEVWVQNDKGERTYKTEGISQIFLKGQHRLGGVFGDEKTAFFSGGYALVRLNLRPLRVVPFAPTEDLNPLGRLGEFLSSHFNDENFGEIRVFADDGTFFYVSKLLLCSQSEVFQRMFAHANTKESREKKIEMHDLEPAIIEAMLRWMHTGKVEGLREMDAALYVPAHLHELVGLQELCIESMAANFSIDSIFDCLQLAGTYKECSGVFKQKAMDYASEHIGQITQDERWDAFKQKYGTIVAELLVAKR